MHSRRWSVPSQGGWQVPGRALTLLILAACALVRVRVAEGVAVGRPAAALAVCPSAPVGNSQAAGQPQHCRRPSRPSASPLTGPMDRGAVSPSIQLRCPSIRRPANGCWCSTVCQREPASSRWRVLRLRSHRPPLARRARARRLLREWAKPAIQRSRPHPISKALRRLSRSLRGHGRAEVKSRCSRCRSSSTPARTMATRLRHR